MNGHYSVITNFGCHWTCPYCIVRETGLNVPVTDMQATLRTISRESEHHPMRFLSFSGGGDPLFPMREPEASKRVAFYREAIHRAGDWLTETEMHTSYFQCGRNVAQVMQQIRFSRVVYHMRPTSLSEWFFVIGDLGPNVFTPYPTWVDVLRNINPLEVLSAEGYYMRKAKGKL